MKGKRIISLGIALLLLLQVLLTVPVYGESYTANSIQICFEGVMHYEKVLTDENRNIYVPLNWLTEYGFLKCKETDTEYEYYYVGQEERSDFARRIFVDKKTRKFSVKIYMPDTLMLNVWEQQQWLKSLSDEERELISDASSYEEALTLLGVETPGYITLYEGRFSSQYTDGIKLWVPIAELLPLLGNPVEIANGCVYMELDDISIWQALYNADIRDVVFNADRDIWGDEFISYGGYAIDTIMSFRFDRLDIVENSGKMKDYETLFKSYLVDDEAYLSAYEQEESPKDRVMNTLKENFKEEKTALDYLKEIDEWTDLAKAKEVLGQKDFSLIENKNSTIKGSDVIGGAMKLYDYYYTYSHQVEDHRNMLLTVYDCYIKQEDSAEKRIEMRQWPSYRAAKNVQELYNTQGPDLEAQVWTTIRDTFWSKVEDIAMDTVLKSIKPYTLTIKITKTLMEAFGEYAPIENGALLASADNVVSLAHNTYIDCAKLEKTDSEALNQLRLAAIMTLVSSKHAYVTYWEGKGHLEDITAINDMLEDFYLAAEGIEMDGSDYYADKAKALGKTDGSLKLYDVELSVTKRAHNLTTLAGLTYAEYELLVDDEGWEMDDSWIIGEDEPEWQVIRFYGSTDKASFQTDFGGEYVEIWDPNDMPDEIWITDQSWDEEGYNGGGHVQIKGDIYTGMTYKEVAALVNLSPFTEDWGSGYAREEFQTGAYIEYYFNTTDEETAVLYGVHSSGLSLGL